MAILNNNPLIGASGNQGGYNINNSLRFRRSASAYLSRTPASATNRKTWTWSGWVKRGVLSYNYARLFAASDGSGNNEAIIGFNSGDTLSVYSYIGAYQLQLTTTQVFRDPSAWYHIVVALDTTQATSSNRCKVYVNGSQVTAFGTATYPSQNYDGYINLNQPHALGYDRATSESFDGYMADVNFIDGSAKTPSDFGETDTTTGVWKPKAYTGTYGTNGFYLKFSDIATTSGSNAGLGKDFSGNSNYWTTNNISVTSGTTYDAMTDSPTNTSATVANYCILNPLSQAASGANYLSQGNLHMFDDSSAAAWRTVFGSHGINSGDGKFYWETTAGTFGASVGGYTGICSQTDNGAPPQTTDVALYWNNAGNFQKERNGSSTALSGTPVAGDVLGVAYDAVNGQIWFSRNGTYFEGNPSAGTGASYTGITMNARPFLSIFSNVGQMSASINFGQRPFSYTPPTGFVALNTFNLPTSTIVKGNSYFDSTLYTGTGSSQSIVNAGGFSPDFVWVKNRSHNDADPYYGVHLLFNTNAGVGNRLMSQSTASEAFSSQSLTAFNSNGFSIGTDNAINYSGDAYVAWQWRGSDNSAVTNTSGTITSTVSANTTAGFSVVTYTGTGANATVGHGLGVAPKWVIIKARGATVNWTSYHEPIGNTAGLHLNTTGGSDVNSGFFNNTSPTSTTFAVGAGSTVNTSSGTYVAYCWAEIAGFSRFGSYTGNGSTNGPFVYLGFRPKYLLIKCTSTAEQWAIKDTSLVPYNTNNTQFFANATDAETTDNTYHMTDFLSNGFKIRGAAQNLVNGNGQTYIYAAFAENPFKNALAR